MKEVNRGNAVLSDPEKRAAYDQLGSRWQTGQDFQPPPGWDAGFEFSGDGANGAQATDFSDFFASLFGRAGRHRGAGDYQMRGGDHHAKILIDLPDAYHGATRTITLRAAKLEESGRVVTEERTINVQIPKGVQEGQHIRLAGQGSPEWVCVRQGDCIWKYISSSPPLYRVEGRKFYETVPWLHGKPLLAQPSKCPLPSGNVQVKVPAGSQAGRNLRLKGAAFPETRLGPVSGCSTWVLPSADTTRRRQIYETMARERVHPRLQMGV